MKRESFGSRLGFLLVSAGCAIGIGNVWRFPYITGVYGGGVFVLFYLLFLLSMGVPVLMMELAVGRAGGGSARVAYGALEKKGSAWHLHGWVCMLGCYLLMMYYTTVSGWMLAFFVKFLTGAFEGLGDEAVRISLLDTLIAVASGLIIFPACFSYGVEPAARGALPAIFPAAASWGAKSRRWGRGEHTREAAPSP